jgi:hypothetical protein
MKRMVIALSWAVANVPDAHGRDGGDEGADVHMGF